MDLSKAKLLLEKINALYRSMYADKNNISTIEKDLMKSYLLQMYESFLDLPQAPVKRASVEVIKSAPKAPKRQPQTPHPATVESPAPAQAPAPKPKPATPPAAAPPPKAEKETTPAASGTKPPKAPLSNKTATVDPEIEELFSFNSAKELSEKLSELPIKDIKKAMGLNERIFTINELFEGDQSVFDLIVDTLNKLPDFEQAKTFLIQNAAIKYKWSAKNKKKKAKTFIKLVKRRYN